MLSSVGFFRTSIRPREGHGDRAPLFGNDDAGGIGALRKSKGRRVAQAEVADSLHIGRKGQVAAEADEPPAIDDDSPVVTDGVGVEDALEQRLAEHPVQGVAAGQMPVEGVLALDDDQGAHVLAGQIRRGLDDDLHLRVERGDAAAFAEAAPGGDSLEEPPKLLLENDHHGQEDDGEKSLEHRRREVELERAGQVVDDAQDTDPHEDKPRGGVPEPDQQSVDHEGDQKDVKKILDPEAVKKDCRSIGVRYLFIFKQ